MRVFDFVGLIEALQEYLSLLDAPSNNEQINDNVQKPREIPSSQDEDVSEIMDILYEEVSLLEPSKLGILVIDNITGIMSTEFSKNQLHCKYLTKAPRVSFNVALAQALMNRLVNLLRRLTGEHGACAILINNAVGVERYSPAKQSRSEIGHISRFVSVLGKPALGKVYANLVDFSVLLSNVPVDDLHSRTSNHKGQRGKHAENVRLLEIIKDRNGNTEGCWAEFSIDNTYSLNDP
jgi:hypothetical protein